VEVLTDIEDLVAFVSWLPKAKLSWEDDSSTIGICAGLELNEKFCGNGRLSIHFFVRRAPIDYYEVPVRCLIAV